MFSKWTIYFAALACAFVIVTCKEELYSDKYDDVDVDTILSNPRQRERYYNCFIGSAPCQTPDAKFFKEHLREAILTNCKRCTEKQKIAFDKITVYYTENELEKYNKLVAKLIEDAKTMNKKN